ncbi:MAG: hypothetical protein CMM32_05680 [Rhodospirillaceae bacterium]|nr:hypothetical protein [Rhodospirillaceae bacterium]|tara:strand:- start:524 stop:760 length:237 start_codon:yes stop_codon:yes gene_type:complete
MESPTKKDNLLPTWLDTKGSPVGCSEKIKVLNENIIEIKEICEEALEDAVLMGCDEKQIREVLSEIITSLPKPFSNRT